MKKYNFKIYFFLLLSIVFVGANPAYAQKSSDKTIKILAIGNSFSQDAIEQYLWNIAQADSIDIVVGNLYFGGCSLEQHWKFLTENDSVYNYRKIVNGIKIDTPHYSLTQALADEHWDYVSFQQASHFSGMPLTYAPFLDELMKYVRQNVNDSTKFMFHSTWAYSQDSKHPGFANYSCSQNVMFDEIIGTTEMVMDAYHFDILIPCGTAIQNARTSTIGDSMTRDGYHLNYVYGRYTAACTWFESIFQRPVAGNPYSPEGITPAQKKIAQESAHAAILSPFSVTQISE